VSTPLLEIAANSVASALAAQDGGADRVEMCGALELGGLTPSHAVISLARERLHIPLYVLIRPRAGDFLYSESEFVTMQRDIEACAQLGCDGIVVGILDAQGDVDVVRCRSLIAAAPNLGVTFHRAFDLVRDPTRALEDIIALGVERVLTSGARPTAREGTDAIRKLIAQAGARTAIMAGAGIDSRNIAALRAATNALEFHASARRTLPSAMRCAGFVGSGMDSGEVRSDVAEIRALVTALRTA
jgi:copper homeostasis protein